MEIYTDLETPSADPQALVFRVVVTGENIDELPTHMLDAVKFAQSCSEILAGLMLMAIFLDRKQDAFQAGLREATALKAAKPSEIINAAHAATIHLGDDNAFAGEVRELWEFPTVTNPLGIQRRSERDRRSGDRRIFEATCLSANKRNANREDRRLNVDRRGNSVSAAIANGFCSSCGEHAPHHFPTCPKVS